MIARGINACLVRRKWLVSGDLETARNFSNAVGRVLISGGPWAGEGAGRGEEQEGTRAVNHDESRCFFGGGREYENAKGRV